MARDDDVILGEMDVSKRFRLAISAFYVEKESVFRTYKVTKLKPTSEVFAGGCCGYR